MTMIKDQVLASPSRHFWEPPSLAPPQGGERFSPRCWSMCGCAGASMALALGVQGVYSSLNFPAKQCLKIMFECN